MKVPWWASFSKIEVIIGALAIVVAIAIFFAQRKTKKLSYRVTSNNELLGVKEEIQRKVQVLYEGKEVKRVHLLTLKFTNDGNQSISSDDFERPLSVSVNSEAKILTHEIIDENPKGLGILASLEANRLTFSPVLLNSKDTFSIKALISNLEGEPKVDGRIRGVKAINRYTERLFVSLFSFAGSLSIIGGAIMWMTVFLTDLILELETSFKYFLLPMAAAFMVTGIVYLARLALFRDRGL